jgi:hypothetical protein
MESITCLTVAQNEGATLHPGGSVLYQGVKEHDYVR